MKILQKSQPVFFCKLCKQPTSNIIFIKNGYKLVRCSSCDLVFVGNPPSKKYLKRIYTFEEGYFSNYMDERVDTSLAFKVAREKYNFIEQYKTQGHILEVGCGLGFFLKVAQENGWNTFGVEISSDFAEFAKNRYGLDIYTGELENANFNPEHFDIIVMWDVVEHLVDPIQKLHNINRILKNDGVLALSTPRIDGLYPKLSYLLSGISGQWRHPEPPFHLYQFSKKSITELLKKSGFRVVNIYNKRIPIRYSFPKFDSFFGSIKRFVFRSIYSIIFIPIAFLAPYLRRGDWMTVIAKKNINET